MNWQRFDLQDPLLGLFEAKDAAPYYNFGELLGSITLCSSVQDLQASDQGFELPIQHGPSIQPATSTPFNQGTTPSNFRRRTTESQSGNSQPPNHNSHRSSDSRYIHFVSSLTIPTLILTTIGFSSSSLPLLCNWPSCKRPGPFCNKGTL